MNERIEKGKNGNEQKRMKTERAALTEESERKREREIK